MLFSKPNNNLGKKITELLLLLAVIKDR